jgi:uncharacterized membrane protein
MCQAFFVSRLLKPKILAAGFAVSGCLHVATPTLYEGIVPRWLPRRRALVYVSGLAELVCAAGLLSEAPWAGLASAGLLVAVWPANVQMAVEGTRTNKPPIHQVALWARVLMQLPMIQTALRSGRSQA